MGISLKSIELSNIRSHKHFIFSPADGGVTAISGPTGSGKSTIIDSLAWVLFGTKPQGVSKASAILREGTDLKTEKCFVVAELDVGGSLLRIKRRMTSKGGAVEVNVDEWNTETKDWDHRAGAAPSHAESYVKQRLKMDEKGFLTAVLVQQKQVDQLISSGPPERARVIEKLTGIASISSGIVAARKEHSGLKKAIELTAVDESQLTSVEKELEEADTRLKSLKGDYKKAKEKLQLVHEDLKGFEADVESKTESFELVENARKTLGEVEVKLEAADSILEDAKVERDEAKSLLSKGSRGVSLEDSLESLRRLRKKVATLESSKLYHEKNLERAKLKLKDIRGTIADSGHLDLHSLERALDELTEKSELVAKKLKKATGGSGELRGEIAQLESAIGVVAHGDNCPTCLQSVEDVAGAVKALEIQREELKSRLAKLEAKAEELQKLQKDQRKDRSSLESLSESFSEAVDLEESVEESERELKDVGSELKAKSSELKGAEKLHKTVEREDENSKRYSAALKRLQKVMETIENLKSKAVEARKTLKESKAPSEQKLTSLRKKLYTMQVAYQEGRVDLNELKSEARILSNSIEHLKDKKRIYSAELETHRELLKSVEISAATMETLQEFRADRVRTALPTIESYASELLSRFTDGKFIALKLDEKFNASVVLSTGAERPVGMLSGGELSAASIALRLSVSMMLNASDSNNLIILDEVLVSQDADRSELILSTIKDVCKGQVVMISHGAGVAAIADKKVDLSGS